MKMNTEELRRRLADPKTRDQAILEISDFWRDLVLTMGGELETASRVGHEMTRGLYNEWKNVDAIVEAARQRASAEQRRDLQRQWPGLEEFPEGEDIFLAKYGAPTSAPDAGGGE